MSALSQLREYVLSHAERGECRCGRCSDNSGNDVQPVGHTADVVFFKVAAKEADAEELRALVAAAKEGEFCEVDLFDGEEHGFMELGGWIGDQGLALTLMGLGAVMGLWKLLTPRTIPGFNEEQAQELAGAGMVTIKS